MKNLLIAILSFGLLVSANAQTRSVLVGTNNTVVSPTNFWSADASNARIGLGLTLSALTNTNNNNFRNAIGLGSAATNPSSAFQSPSLALSNLVSGNGGALTNLQATSLVGVIPATNIGAVNFSNLSGTLTISSGGTSATNASQARSNLGLGWSALTNTTASGFISALYGVGTNPVLTDSNGNVVSPTNFVWGGSNVAAYYSRIQSFTNAATHNVTNGSHVLVYSFFDGATNTTNTLDLPTVLESATNGDMVTIVHLGTTSSLTGVRKEGNITNFTTLSKPNESIRLIYNGSDWVNIPSQAQNSPIYFTGTNVLVNSSISRTNLGLGATWLTNTNATNFRSAIGLGTGDSVQFSNLSVGNSGSITSGNAYFNFVSMNSNGSGISFDDSSVSISTNGISFNSNTASNTRTNLSLGASWLTNTNITNFRSSTLPVYGGANHLLGLNSNNSDVTFIAPQLLTFEILPPSTNAGYLLAINAATNGVEWIPVPPSLITFPITIANGGTGGTNAAQARTNLGIPLAALTNTTTTNFNSAIGLGTGNNVTFGGLTASGAGSFGSTVVVAGGVVLSNTLSVTGAITFGSAAATRTNLGLGGGVTTNISVTGTNNTNTLYFSNGIFTNVTSP